MKGEQPSRARKHHAEARRAASRCPNCGGKIKSGRLIPGIGVACARCAARAEAADSAGTGGARP
jgi:hypothetical protein